MSILEYTAFYPSRTFWAVSKVNFDNQHIKNWFEDQMAEEVFSEETETYTLKICRDGRIMLRIKALEEGLEISAAHTIEQAVKRWGEYLDYLNALYLLLDSSTIKFSSPQHFNLHEITNRDAFRVTYEAGKLMAENIAMESLTSVLQKKRYLSSYRTGLPIEYDHELRIRQVVSLDVIKHVASEFTKVVTAPDLAKTLASFAKSLSEYKIGNYETSIILSWFITEATLNHLWKTHIESLNENLAGDQKRINSERKKFLTDRNFTISVVSNLLELWKVLPFDQFADIDKVRGFRNKIVHGDNLKPGASDAQLAMKTAQAMINRRWGFSFTPNLSYSLSGLV